MKHLRTPQHVELCRVLTRLREILGLKQCDVAKVLGRPQSFVSDYERGQRRLGVLEFMEVCAVLQADPRDVLTVILKLPGGPIKHDTSGIPASKFKPVMVA